MSKIVVDETACRRCGACVAVCIIANVYELRDGAASQAVRPEACWGCGQCVSVCPADAIDHDQFPLEKCPLIDHERSMTPEQLTVALRTRRSVRTFAERPVARDVVRELVGASRWGPSAENSQDVDWIAIDDRARITELSKAAIDTMRRFLRLAGSPFLRPILRLTLGREAVDSAVRNRRVGDDFLERWSKGNDPLFYNAPVILIGHAKSGRPFARDDAVYAAYNLMLAADRRGLSSCQIGIFQVIVDRSRKVQRMLGLPERRSAQIILTLGYPLHGYRRLVPRRAPELVWNPR